MPNEGLRNYDPPVNTQFKKRLIIFYLKNQLPMINWKVFGQRGKDRALHYRNDPIE